MTDAPSTTGSAAPPATGGAPSAGNASLPAGGAPSGAAPVAAQRPEWLPESYFDPAAGIKPEFGQHYTELQKFQQTETERQTALKARKPEDIKLEVKLPDTVKVPEGMKIAIDEKDPRVAAVREVALKNGWTQEQVNDLATLDATWKIQAHNAEIERVKAEDLKLGANGKDRKTAAASWLNTIGFTDDEMSEMRVTASTAAGVTAIEKLMQKLNGSVPGTVPVTPPKPAEVPMAHRWYGAQQKVS